MTSCWREPGRRATRPRAEVGLAVHASRGTDDTAVTIAVVTPAGEVVEHRTAFLGGCERPDPGGPRRGGGPAGVDRPSAGSAKP